MLFYQICLLNIRRINNRSTGYWIKTIEWTSAKNTQKKLLMVNISVTVSLLHFVTGSAYIGPFPVFVNGCMIDILLPFSIYFLLYLVDMPYSNPGRLRLSFLCSGWRLKRRSIWGSGLKMACLRQP